jgi:hypothetical protein
LETRQLSANEVKFLAALTDSSQRLAKRLNEFNVILHSIVEEDHICEHCGEVAQAWLKVEPEFKMLTKLTEAMIENGMKASLASQMLELIGDGGVSG